MARKRLLTFKEACEWANSYLKREVTESNISYLVQYGKIRRYDERGDPKTTSNGATMISLEDLKRYYDRSRKREKWTKHLGEDVNWELSFDNMRESERTKHVHRLHPYKGKFIPQLVEYFLDSHTNNLKKTVFFREGDIILDPFVGSGTTLVQCLELGLHSIGIDISKFNCVISDVKIQKYDLDRLSKELQRAAKATQKFSDSRFRHEPHGKIDLFRSSFNKKYYPTPEFRILLRLIREYQAKIGVEIERLSKSEDKDETEMSEKALVLHREETAVLEEKVGDFLRRNSAPLQFKVEPGNVGDLDNEFSGKYAEFVLDKLSAKIGITKQEKQTRLTNDSSEPFADLSFLSSWFTTRQRVELQHYLDQIQCQKDPKIRNVMRIILSRTARSCRATKHVDLATLKEPQSEPYYCRKHFQICRPVPTIIHRLRRYTEDTIDRIKEFSHLRKDVFCEVIYDDSRTFDLFDYIAKNNHELYRIVAKKRIDGIFTSPPYVGQIDYHEQHAYSYELFGIDRRDHLEIGRKSNGTSAKAQQKYISGISAVLLNMKQFLRENSHIFIVANDRRNLYPKIAAASGLKIDEEFRRPVLNRTERDKQPYAESVFHMSFE